MLLKYCTQYVCKFEKLSRRHKSGKGQFLFQSQRRAVPKNVPSTVHLDSFYMLQRLCSKFSMLGLSSAWTKNFQTYKLGSEKAEEPEIKLPAFVGSHRKQGNSEKHLLCFIEFAKAFDLWITTNCGKFLKRWEYQTTLPVSTVPQKPVCRSRSNS